MDPNKMTQEDIDSLMAEELGDQAIYRKPNTNPYVQGMQLNIPDEYSQDYLSEYERLSQPENYDPLLMYILQKNAQSGFKNGPIGSDSYYEAFDPEYNEDLYPDFTQFIDTYYPDFDDDVQDAYYDMLNAYMDKYPKETNKYPDTPDFDKLEIMPEYKKFNRLNNLNYYRTNQDPQQFEIDDLIGELDYDMRY